MPYRLEQFSNFTVLPLDQDCFKMRFASVVVFDRTILIGGLRRNGRPANVFHNAGGTITYNLRPLQRTTVEMNMSAPGIPNATAGPSCRRKIGISSEAKNELLRISPTQAEFTASGYDEVVTA